MHNWSSDCIFTFATTGKAASLLQGCTLHCPCNGLSIPCSETLFKHLSSQSLKRMQDKYKNARLVFIDECSMLQPADLHFVNLRLQEVVANSLPFGGLIVVLVGDFGQLIPVGSDWIFNIIQFYLVPRQQRNKTITTKSHHLMNQRQVPERNHRRNVAIEHQTNRLVVCCFAHTSQRV